VATHGKSHEQTFDVACEVDELGVNTQGQGASRRTAEQMAAQLALQAVMALPSSRLPAGARATVVVKKSRTAKAPPKAAT